MTYKETLEFCREHRAKANEFAEDLGLPGYNPQKPATLEEARALCSDLAYLRWELGGRIRFRTERRQQFEREAKQAERKPKKLAA